MSAKDKPTIVTNITGCARCGERHQDLLFKRLLQPSGHCTHWTICPRTQEPLLLEVRCKQSEPQSDAADLTSLALAFYRRHTPV